jgi:tRNA1Val (adenine37-N6)-methyltransferase
MKVTTDACLFGAWTARCIRQHSLTSGKLLDIGSGTGLLALMVAQNSDLLIDAVEKDRDAFEQAVENFSNSPWKERLSAMHADARKILSTVKYDVIVSNPPFYENELKSPDQKKNLAHHGGLALSELLGITRKNLEASGQFYLLLPAKRGSEAARLINEFQLRISELITIRQSPTHEPFRVFIRGQHTGNDNTACIQKEIIIWNELKEYSPEFISLLKDYYLYL